MSKLCAMCFGESQCWFPEEGREVAEVGLLRAQKPWGTRKRLGGRACDCMLRSRSGKTPLVVSVEEALEPLERHWSNR
jgi:hypothetical protein